MSIHTRDYDSTDFLDMRYDNRKSHYNVCRHVSYSYRNNDDLKDQEQNMDFSWCKISFISWERS